MVKDTTHKIVFGDSRNMGEAEDSSVHLIVTSPPYWQLKDYEHDDQIGFNDTYEEYINNLNHVWNESYRILHDGCRLCINIGDQFARSIYYGRYKVIPIRTEIIKYCESIGFDYMGAIIWQKVTTTNTTGGATIMGSFPYPRNGILKIDYEFILLFKKPGKGPKPSEQQKKDSRLTTEEWNELFSGHWNFAGSKQIDHIASFPIELPHRLIRMFSFKSETVCDPFLGSGTTTIAAMKLGRSSLGFEINENYKKIIINRIDSEVGSLFSNTVEYLKGSSFEGRDTENDNYRFVDYIKMDKKIDPNKLYFGSKINNKSPKSRLEYYKVTNIISESNLILNSNLEIKMIGIKLFINKDKVIEYLKNNVLGKKVSLKFDTSYKYDDNGILCAYVYLENKTFINAHLVKYAGASVEENISYDKKDKFLSLQEDING
ncbi:MAG: DNA methyltransferase [bacterium]